MRSIVGGWIEEIKLQRKAAVFQLRRTHGNARMTGEEIRSLVHQLKGLVALLENADPADRRAVYQKLNVSIEFHTDGRLHVRARPSACTNDRVGGPSSTRCPRLPSAQSSTWLTERTANPQQLWPGVPGDEVGQVLQRVVEVVLPEWRELEVLAHRGRDR
jgi:hypothetical protein